MLGLRCRERAGGKRDGELVVGEEERKEAIVDDKCRGMSGMMHEMEEGLFEKFIEIVIFHAVRLLISEFMSPFLLDSFGLPR